jgi:hypothetical protein
LKEIKHFNGINNKKYLTQKLILAKNISNKANCIVLAGMYSILFIVIYKTYLYPIWEYTHYHLIPRNIVFIILSLFISVLPVAFYRGQKAISSYLAVIIYMIVYVPTIFTFIFALKRSILEIVSVQLCFAFGMILFFLADSFNIKNFIKPIKKQLSFNFIHLITLILTIIVFFSYLNYLRFVSFDKVYEQRELTSKLSINPIVGYFIMWLTSCLYPLYLAIGLINKKKLFFLIGIVGLVLIYMVSGAKLALLTPVIILGIFYLIKENLNRLFSVFILAIISISTILLLIGPDHSKIVLWMSSLLFMRTIGVGGLLNSLYYDFFTLHDYTYFTHINIVRWITGYYPYGDLGLGQVIGAAYYNGPEMNANANFWAWDGIASCGHLGIIIISLIIFVFMLFLNMLTKKTNKVFLILIFTAFALTMTNVSFFTALLSGGGILLVLILYLIRIPLRNEEFIKV